MSLSREISCDVLVRYDAGRGQLRQIMEQVFEKTPGVEDKDKAFCRELTNETVRRLNTLDWALQQFSHMDLGKLEPAVLGVLRLGACQILFMPERVPSYAAVNESVRLAKKHGHAGVASFVNGTLRSLERKKASLPWPPEKDNPVHFLSLVYSHPEWLVQRWHDVLGAEECAALLKKNNEAPDLCVRVNTLRKNRHELFHALMQEKTDAGLSRVSSEGIRLEASPSLKALKTFQDGDFIVQDDSSQMAVHVLDPRPGETVIDMCAGVGGKSTHMAQRMNNQGTVKAVDANAQRLALMKDNCARMGCSVVESVLMEAQEAGQAFQGTADRVLVDAPCSGLGVIRRRPDIRWNKESRHVMDTMPALQFDIMEKACVSLKPGGTLVYCTCSAESEENEQVVRRFLEANQDFRIAWPGDYMPVGFRDAITREGFIRFWPHRHDMDGFFIAKMMKRK